MYAANCPRLIVFSKPPVPGLVKTRMVPPLTYSEAALLYDSFVKETIRLIEKIKGVEKILCSYVQKLSTGPLINNNWTIQAQQGDDFGERLLTAVRMNIGSSNPVLLIGTDSPTIPSYFINSALKALKKHKIVIGPAIDGGFYLLGLQNYYSHIFDNVVWSSRHTLNGILRNIENIGIDPFFIPKWYDIDNIDDLKLLISHLECLPDHKLKIIRNTIDYLCLNITKLDEHKSKA